MAESSAVVAPNLGLYLDRPPIAMNSRMLQDGYNFRIKNGRLSNLNLGWTSFMDRQLDGVVRRIVNFNLRSGAEELLFITDMSIYRYVPGDEDVVFLNEQYDTGTAAASGTAVTGVGTNWDPEAKAGDYIHFGAANQNDPGAVWYEIASVTNDTALVLTATAGTIAAGPYTIRKTFTADASTPWDDEVFVYADPSLEDELWLTNGRDEIVRWNGTDATVENMGTTLGFKAKTLAVYANMMIFGNLTVSGEEKPQDIINSDIGKPAAAGDAGTGLSEQFRVHGNSDHITSMRVLGDNLSIYSEYTVTIAQFAGDPLVFVFRQAVSGIGALALNAVADFGNYHEFLGNDSQYIFDGVTIREINEHVWRELIRQRDAIRASQVYAVFDEENGDLVWVVPSTTDPDAGDADAPPVRATVEHYLEQSNPNVPTPFSLRAWPFTAAGDYKREGGLTWADINDQWQNISFRWNDKFFFSSFPIILTGDAEGYVWIVNVSQDKPDGTGLPSYVRFGRRAMIDGRMRGLIKRVYPFVTALATPLNVSVRIADHAMGTITTTDTQSFDQQLPEGGHFSVHYRRGRYIEIQFGTDGPGQPYELSGFDVDIVSGGRR